MMDGRNSTGRKVSLLNDLCTQQPSSAAAAHVSAKPSSLTNEWARSQLQLQSRSPSSASTPTSPTPQTPSLARSESTDSRNYATPSPVTPHFASFDHNAQLALHQDKFYAHRPSLVKMDDSIAAMYPSVPEVAGMMPYSLSSAQQQPHAHYRASNSPVSESHVSTGSTASTKQQQNQQQPKKNQYPCPMAKQYNCTDYFTTSGHAARHAKKHTGKKDAFCPECNKAFTRKDNMEQHRRTHQNVRGPSRSAADNRIKKTSKQSSRKSDKCASAPLEAAIAQLEEEQQQQQQQQRQAQPQQQPAASMMPQQVPVSMGQTILPSATGPYYVSADPVQALPQPMPLDFSGRPQLYRSSFTNSLDFIPQAAPTLQDPSDHFAYPSPGLSHGLNTLALAASDHRRMSEEESS